MIEGDSPYFHSSSIFSSVKYPDRSEPYRQRHWIMPILRADWQIGPKTKIRSGLQVCPFSQKCRETWRPQTKTLIERLILSLLRQQQLFGIRLVHLDGAVSDGANLYQYGSAGYWFHGILFPRAHRVRHEKRFIHPFIAILLPAGSADRPMPSCYSVRVSPTRTTRLRVIEHMSR